MSRPAKPFEVLINENKSHRTKAELAQRKQGEEALASGTTLRERSEVKNNIHAHKEFLRINKLLKNIKKNDALYEPIINRYCMIQAECSDLEERREEFYSLLKDIRSTFKEITINIEISEKISIMLDVSKELAKITTSMNNIDALIQTKRKMLLDIEKENIFTIASALRSIPKKAEKPEEEDPMDKILNRRQRRG